MTVRSTRRYPEFGEYFVHYPLKRSKYSSHYYFQKYVEQDEDVLDLGCGEGFFAELIADKGNRIVGVDLLEQPQKIGAFKAYWQADLSRGLVDVLDKLHGLTFDKVLLPDVIEHLPKPEVLLQDCKKVLDTDGQLLVSVPNVANFTVRFALLFGRFNYTERGILDKTHLRFFTVKTARRLLKDNGFDVIREKATIIPFEIALGLSPDNRIVKILEHILAFFTGLLPGLLGYQLIFVARPKPVNH
jgi:2-polyprenyl-3-methyl-5-hydroxy-6-metoxy-1,4-benzoquinol methylase